MMQIPLQTYFTISPNLLLNQYGNNKTAITERVPLNILLDDPALLTPAFFAKVGAMQNDRIFSLSYELVKDRNILTGILPKLYLLSTLNLSLKKEGTTVPVFLDQSGDTVNTDLIASYFQSQGNENVSIPAFYYQRARNSVQYSGDCTFLMYSSNPQTHINHLFSNENQVPRLIIIGFEEVITRLDLFEEIVNTITATESNLISLTYDDFYKYYIEKEVFEEEEKLWKKRVLLYKNFLLLSKKVQQKEYYEVLDWYRNEYESLPLWYKRFGHIVKVLVGKRTFRSLFSDSVKKYKD